MAKTIGIDLGTTNSCVAVIEGGEPVVITEGDRVYRVSFAVDRPTGIDGFIADGDATILATVEAHEAQGWHTLGQQRRAFLTGVSGRYDQNTHTYDRRSRERLAAEVLRDTLTTPPVPEYLQQQQQRQVGP